MITHIKDPDAVLDYSVSWENWLQTGEEISISAWTITGVDSSLIEGAGLYASTNDATTTTIWLSGGAAPYSYRVTNRITTDSTPPRIEDRSFIIQVIER